VWFGRAAGETFRRDIVVQELPRVPGVKARNVVFILADAHRYDAMGFMGHPIVK
jgi:hypothetical protein